MNLHSHWRELSWKMTMRGCHNEIPDIPYIRDCGSMAYLCDIYTTIVVKSIS